LETLDNILARQMEAAAQYGTSETLRFLF